MTGRHGQQSDRRNMGCRARTPATGEVHIQPPGQAPGELTGILFGVRQAFGARVGAGAGNQMCQRLRRITQQTQRL